MSSTGPAYDAQQGLQIQRLLNRIPINKIKTIIKNQRRRIQHDARSI